MVTSQSTTAELSAVIPLVLVYLQASQCEHKFLMLVIILRCSTDINSTDSYHVARGRPMYSTRKPVLLPIARCFHHGSLSYDSN